MKDSTCPFVPNFLLGVAGGIQYLKLKKVSKQPQKASEQTLRGILEYAKDTVYGKEHHFAEILEAGTAEELYRRYQQYVPANDYEDLRPYVDRHKNGEAGILFPGKPLMYATTSGTASEPKWIPITDVYLKSVYGKMTKVWLFNFIKNRPKVFSGKIVSIVGKVIEGYAPDGTMFGSVSGVTQRDCPGFVKKLYASPADVYSIADYKARYYAIMRMGIERNTTLIVTANPSTIVEMQNNVNEFYDQYVEDIEKGTLNASLDIAPEIRAAIAPYLKPNPERANELRALKAQYGTVLPKHYWPNLQILNTWKCGNTKVYVDKFQNSFPDRMLHQEFGYFSSECRFGLVLDDTNNTVLFPHFHFYEFIAEEDLNNPNPRFLQLQELKEGKRYCPYVTTFAGLYRYNMNDLVEVGPSFGNTPTVHMIQKVNGIVTMTGEKLHERQFIEAVHEAERTLQMPAHFFVGFADMEQSAYRFYYEFEDENTTQEAAERFTAKVDEVLKRINIEYAVKRDSFRVKDPITHRLQHNSFERFKAQCIAEGARDGQFKMNLLLQDEKRHAKFKQLVVNK
ncbi:MAG: GH3 auxin-responsive promoter family protein [Paludibacter sp.]|nr:GH3 auxin-responsive promoter family protein [Bacteroidales bacterium]MCM1069093.1 GH3 auxin-responsive promoter family protein [Prevotella sp.]MCM1353532.1 GH3 auxin-responsive promoter family protein [Bacteroides sp.]MCM1442693.1 GH3 auxin-responsive promoter family protein [Muribaculum sp.]MCM1481671.1 GH3 auxin-responsive promoter family protein [Paludibacter sp.]